MNGERMTIARERHASGSYDNVDRMPWRMCRPLGRRRMSAERRKTSRSSKNEEKREPGNRVRQPLAHPSRQSGLKRAIGNWSYFGTTFWKFLETTIMMFLYIASGQEVFAIREIVIFEKLKQQSNRENINHGLNYTKDKCVDRHAFLGKCKLSFSGIPINLNRAITWRAQHNFRTVIGPITVRHSFKIDLILLAY